MVHVSVHLSAKSIGASQVTPGERGAIKMAARVAEVSRMRRISTSTFLSRGAFGFSSASIDSIKKKLS